MRIKIVSDGDPINTKLTNADTGETLDGMYCTKIVIDAKEPWVVATFRIERPIIDVTIRELRFERESTLTFDPDDIDSIDRSIAELQRQRAARMAS